MAGQPDHGYPIFEAAAEKLRGAGYVVFSPHEGAPSIDLIESVMVREKFDDFRDTTLYAQMMKRNTIMLLQADIVFMLPDWHTSRGATFENELAKITGIPVADGAWLINRK